MMYRSTFKHIIAIAGQVLLTCYFAHAQQLDNIGAQKPVAVSGSLQLSGIFYRASGISDRRAPFTYIFSGSPTLSLYGVAVPFNFILSQQDRAVSQPFNQFGLSPQYKWITVHAGYRSITFSPYTLAGYTMLGAGFELNPDKFRVGFMYGRLNRATKLDTASQSLVPYSFTRKAYAAKIGYGTADRFFELSMLKGKDDALSGPPVFNPVTQLVLPEANTVVGASGKFTFLNKLFVEGNVGLSIYTRDVNSKLAVDSANRLVKLAGGIALVNGTTEYYYAYDAALGYREKTFSIKFQYLHIDPDFKSFGAYFFDNDLVRYSFAPSFQLLNNKIRFNGNIGFQHDDVKGHKQSATKKVITNANIGADITSKLGIDLSYTNFSNNQQPKTIRFADSLKVAQTTQNISITPHLFLVNKTTTNAVVAGINIMQLNDFNTAFSQAPTGRNINSNQFFINYTYGYMPLQFNAFINLNMVKMNAAGITDKNTGFIIGASKSFLKSALRASASGGLSNDVRNNGSGNVFNCSGNVQYNYLKRHTFSLTGFFTNNQPKNIKAIYPAFTETRIELGYNYTL